MELVSETLGLKKTAKWFGECGQKMKAVKENEL